MSRSYKKPYLVYVSHSSNKMDKVYAHKVFRAKEKEEIRKAIYCDDDNLPKRMMDISDVWDFSSDGKPYYSPDLLKECKELFGWAKWFKK